MKRAAIVFFLVWGVTLAAQTSKQLDCAAEFGGRPGCFIVVDRQANTIYRYDEARCGRRFLPASSFKIPHALLALETGVCPDENLVIPWDSVQQPVKEWNRSHTLASAMEFSVVPYFRELARRIGREREQRWLDTLGYGNRMIGDAPDLFWLDNSLKISAEEQIAFLDRFVDETLPCSRRSIGIVKKILPSEAHGDAVMRFKTGGGEMDDGRYVGWLIGYVTRGEKIFLFSMNVEGATFEEIRVLRITLARNVLKSLKIIDDRP